MITRRCSQRLLLLTPSRAVNAILRYLVAICAKRHGIRLLAFVFSTTHFHLLLEDPRGVLPRFMADLDQLIARALNAYYGRCENLWAPGSYNNVEITDEETLLEKLLYVITNPVKDGLIERPERWPGLISLPEDMGARPEVAMRPGTAFFGGKRPPTWEAPYTPRDQRLARIAGRRSGRRRQAQPTRARYRAKPSTLPELGRLEIHVPTGWVGREEEYRRRAREALDQRLEEIHADRRAAGLHAFMGSDRIRNQDPLSSAGETQASFALNPTIAGVDTRARIGRIRHLQNWREDYAARLLLWRRGNRNVQFPLGTWAMRQVHGVRVVGLPDQAQPPPNEAA